jgi:hypothetical protein
VKVDKIKVYHNIKTLFTVLELLDRTQRFESPESDGYHPLADHEGSQLRGALAPTKVVAGIAERR